MPQFTTEELIRRSLEIEAKERAWQAALGVPEGFRVPDKPLPAALAQLEAELAAVTKEVAFFTEARLATPEGQESEGLGFAMVKLRDRRWQLQALKKEWGKQPK